MSHGSELFQQRHAKTIDYALVHGDLRKLFYLASHPFFVWPKNGTYELVKLNKIAPFRDLFEYMKFNALKDFQWDPETLHFPIRLKYRNLYTFLATKGCPVTRDTVLFIVKKGNVSALQDLMEFITYDIQSDLELQLIAIQHHSVSMFKYLRGLQGTFHSDVLNGILASEDTLLLNYLLTFEEWIAPLKQDIVYVNSIGATNKVRVVETLLEHGFQYSEDLMIHSLRNNATAIVELLLTKDLKYRDKQGVPHMNRLFIWNGKYVTIAASYNSYETLKWLLEYGMMHFSVPSSALLPKTILDTCLTYERVLRKENRPTLYPFLYKEPLSCMKYVYELGAWIPLHFLKEIQNLIKEFDIQISSSVKAWIYKLQSNLIFQIVSLIPVKKEK